jgi:hypothetical protein
MGAGKTAVRAALGDLGGLLGWGWHGLAAGFKSTAPPFGVGCKAGPYRATNSRFTWPDDVNGDMAKVVPGCAESCSGVIAHPK